MNIKAALPNTHGISIIRLEKAKDVDRRNGEPHVRDQLAISG